MKKEHVCQQMLQFQEKNKRGNYVVVNRKSEARSRIIVAVEKQ